MNAKVEQILRKQAYDFAIKCGATETEAQVAADNKIRSVLISWLNKRIIKFG